MNTRRACAPRVDRKFHKQDFLSALALQTWEHTSGSLAASPFTQFVNTNLFVFLDCDFLVLGFLFLASFVFVVLLVCLCWGCRGPPRDFRWEPRLPRAAAAAAGLPSCIVRAGRGARRPPREQKPKIPALQQSLNFRAQPRPWNPSPSLKPKPNPTLGPRPMLGAQFQFYNPILTLKPKPNSRTEDQPQP